LNYKLNKSAAIISQTTNDYDHTVGYHDISPFNENKDNILTMHRFPLKNTDLSNNIKAEICLWHSRESIIEKIDETDSWSWEQGSRLQWLNCEEIIYNIKKNKKNKSCIYNINNKQKKILESPIYSLSQKNKKFLYINYSRIRHFWKNYGYEFTNKIEFERQPANDGVYLSDFDNNQKLVLSIEEAIDICGLKKSNQYFFIAHPTFSPKGDKFVSLLRFINESGILISYFICTDLNKDTHTLLAREKVSHFEWIDNDTIVVWCRNLSPKYEKIRFNKYLEKYVVSSIKKILKLLKPGIQQKLISTHYHVIKLNNPHKLIKLDENNLTEDGHPQVSKNGKFLITDTYANKIGYQKLLLYDLIKNKTHIVGEFKVSNYLKNKNLKYDLHPRWNHNGNKISIDSSHDGSRQSYIIDIQELINTIS
jgi:hypothetical protein